MTITNEIQTPQSFEERVKEHFRNAIGELLTDEEILKITQKSMDEIFFKEKVIQKNGYYAGTEVIPCLAHKIVKELVEEQIKDAIKEYIKSNNEELQKIIKETLEKDVASIFMAGFSNIFKMQTYQLQNDISEKFRQLGA